MGVMGWAFWVLGGHEIFGFNSKVRFGHLWFRIRASFTWLNFFLKGLKVELLRF